MAQSGDKKGNTKDGPGAKHSQDFAKVVKDSATGKDTLALAPRSSMAALGATMGLHSQYEPLEANLIAKINDDLSNGLPPDPAEMALLNSLVQLDEAETMENVASLLESIKAGSGESSLAEGGLGGAESGGGLAGVGFGGAGMGGAGFGEADAMMQSSLDSLGMSGMMAAQVGAADMGVMSGGPAIFQGLPAQAVTSMAIAPGPVVTPVVPVEMTQPMVVSTTPAGDAGAVTSEADAIASQPVANVLPSTATTGSTGSDPAASTPETTGAVPTPEGSAAADTRVVIVNPEDSGGPLSYTLSGTHPYTIEPGYTQVLTDRPSWLIEFDRGESFGQAKYNIGPGTYTFTATEKGWELYNTTYNVVLDNTANDNPFHFVTDGQVRTVKAGETCTLTGNYAIVVSFDRGDGGEPYEKACKSGTYRIGVNDKTQLLDLLADPADGRTEQDPPTTASR